MIPTRGSRVAAVLFAVLLGCEGNERPPDETPVLDTMAAVPPPDSAAFDPARFARGRAIHDAHCAECHAIDDPPVTAPLFREIATSYAAAFTESTEAIEHLVRYTRNPDLGESRLEKAQIDEWGVMPPIDLEPDELRAVAYFIWHLQGGASPDPAARAR